MSIIHNSRYRTCLLCGKEFIVLHKASVQKFCCRDHSTEYARQNFTYKQCQECGQPFKIKTKTREQKFCSKACKDKARIGVALNRHIEYKMPTIPLFVWEHNSSDGYCMQANSALGF